MPIENFIEDRYKRVYSRCHGIMTLEDFKDYVKRIWSDARCYGYDELFDVRQGDWDNFDFSNLFVVASDAAQLAAIDPGTKLAWVVLEGKQKALTDFYKNLKAVLPANSRALKAFYTEEEAIAWLSE